MSLATCVTGQLLLIELMCKLKERVKTFKLVQSNTDGIMFAINPAEYSEVKNCIDDWSKLHNLVMEEDKIKKVVQANVNNYIIELENRKLKYKGATLVDYKRKDYWKHNSLAICAEAVVKKLIYNTPIVQTINECTELKKFQMITKTGRTYFDTQRLINGEYVSVQKVNRVFAGTDPSKGAIYKVKMDKDKEGNERIRYDKTANCPICTLVDGYDDFTIEDINKNWYIEYATNKYNDFIKKESAVKCRKRKTKN